MGINRRMRFLLAGGMNYYPLRVIFAILACLLLICFRIICSIGSEISSHHFDNSFVIVYYYCSLIINMIFPYSINYFQHYKITNFYYFINAFDSDALYFNVRAYIFAVFTD